MKMIQLSEFILGCNTSDVRETVIIAPCWHPNTVGIECLKPISKGAQKVWDCEIDGTKFTYIKSGIGACLCADIVMALCNTVCSKIMLIGSAGAITEDINVGDIVFPDRCIVGEGATRFLMPNLDTDSFGKVVAVPSEDYINIFDNMQQALSAIGVNCRSGATISVESLYSQFGFISDFIALGAECIDMEASAFLTAAHKVGFKGAVCFCISDNIRKDHPLFDEAEKMAILRKNVRKNALPIIIKTFAQLT